MSVNYLVPRVELKTWLDVISKSFTFAGNLSDVYRMARVSFSNQQLSVDVTDGVGYCHVQGIPYESKSTEAATFLLPFDEINKLIAASGKEKVKFTCGENAVVIETEGKYKLPFADAGHFPLQSLPKSVTEKITVDLKFADISGVLNQFAGKELSRPELSGITICNDYYVGTSGMFGAVHSRVEDKLSRTNMNSHAVRFLTSLPSATLKEVVFANSESSFCIIGTNFYYLCRLPVVEFPYAQLDTILATKEQHVFKALVDSASFYAALRRVLLLDTDKFAKVSLEFSREVLLLRHEDASRGSVCTEEIAISEIRMPAGAGDEHNVTEKIVLSVLSIDALRKLFVETSGLALMFTVCNPGMPLFVQQKDSGYMYYTATLRG